MMLRKSCLTNRSVRNTSQKLDYAKKENFIGIILIFLIYLLKTLIVGTS